MNSHCNSFRCLGPLQQANSSLLYPISSEIPASLLFSSSSPSLLIRRKEISNTRRHLITLDPSNVEHRLLKCRMYASHPLRLVHIERSTCSPFRVHRTVEIASAAFAEEVCVVGRRADGDGFGSTTEEITKVVGLQQQTEVRKVLRHRTRATHQLFQSICAQTTLISDHHVMCWPGRPL